MACISSDGKPTQSGTKMLHALKLALGAPEEIAQNTGLPLFKVRSGLREIAQAGLATETSGKYTITEKGVELIK